MILSETSSCKLSHISFWIVLGLGALLLPIAAQTPHTQASEKAKRTIDDRSHADEIEKLQDEIELLKVRVKLKEVHRDATEKKLKECRRRMENYKSISRSQAGAISTDRLMDLQLSIVTHEGQLQINEAELHESQIQLKQAERRLVRLQSPTEKTDGGGRAQQEKRLRDLELKVENLLKEIHKMRDDTRQNKSRAPDSEHKEAQGFIDRVWSTLDTTRLEDSIPKARKAFQKCKSVGDRISLQKLLKGAEGHADRLRKKLELLHPELVIDDEKEAQQLKKVSDQIIKLGEDITEYLKACGDDK